MIDDQLPRKPPRLPLRVSGTRVGEPARPLPDGAATRRLALHAHTTTLQSLARRTRSTDDNEVA